VLAVVEPGNDLVSLGELVTDGIAGDAAWKDPEQQDLRVGKILTQRSIWGA
jgi:hypothetical protein